MHCVVTYQRVGLVVVALSTFFGWIPQSPSSAEAVIPVSLKDKNSIRLRHSRELLGVNFALSGIYLTANDDLKIEQYIRGVLKTKLSGLPSKQVNRVHASLMKAAATHHFDPLFLLAVIENESKFNPKALGTSGEVGLMQIRPSTARWIAKRDGIQFKGAHALEDPAYNILVGSRYLSYLRERFDSKSELYVAAYNMGEGGVIKKSKAGQMPKLYTRAILRHYSRYYSEYRSYSESLLAKI